MFRQTRFFFRQTLFFQSRPTKRYSNSKILSDLPCQYFQLDINRFKEAWMYFSTDIPISYDSII
ncbi:hypothetical protein IX324_001067 [Bacteroides pyogenes]|nr:hypothetical protein [Bacteroides pyogenes]